MPDCDGNLLNYQYTNTSVTATPPIIYSKWEVRNSSNELIASLEDSGKIDFVYAFPYLDVFTVKLTVRDSGLNEDSETKTYIVDECPICTGGGGGPSVPTIAENRAELQLGEIGLVGMSTEDIDICHTEISAIKVSELDSDGIHVKVTARLKERKTRKSRTKNK